MPYFSEITESILTQIELGELPNDLDYILTCVKEEIKENNDSNYSSEEEKSDSEEEEDDLIKEKVTIQKTEDGFYEIKDVELEGCNRVGKSNYYLCPQCNSKISK